MRRRIDESLRAAQVALRQWRVLTAKELLQLWRDRILLVFLLYAFTLDVYISGAGVSFQLKQAAVLVDDQDRTPASRELIHRFRPPYFRLDGEVESDDQAARALDAGRALAVLEIPPKFHENLRKGRAVDVLMQLDASSTNQALLAAGYAQEIVAEFGLEAALRQAQVPRDRLRTLPIVENAHRVWFNPNLIDAWFMSLSELMQVVTLFSVLLPAVALAREKERGTIEQMLVSPLSSFQIMLPKLSAMALVVLAGALLCIVLVLRPAFDVPLRGSLALFLLLTAAYVFTLAGFGLVVAALSRSLAQAGMTTILVVVPMMFLSGLFTPPEAMPGWLRGLMAVSPLTYYLDVTYGIFLKGAGPSLLLPSVAPMLALGAAIFSFGLWRFRKQFD
jgi:ABC-2 type transport system permease protein